MQENYWAERLRNWRKERGWDQLQVEILANISQSQISQMENGKKNFTQKSLDKLLKLYKKSYNDLFGYVTKEDLLAILDHNKRSQDPTDFDPSTLRKPPPTLSKLLKLFP